MSRTSVPSHLAILVSQILNDEGFPALWYRSGGSILVVTDAPHDDIAHAVTLASVGV